MSSWLLLVPACAACGSLTQDRVQIHLGDAGAQAHLAPHSLLIGDDDCHEHHADKHQKNRHKNDGGQHCRFGDNAYVETLRRLR